MFCQHIYMLSVSFSTQTFQGKENNGSMEFLHSTQDGGLRMIKFYLLHIVMPTVCLFGIVGNIFNILVVSITP